MRFIEKRAHDAQTWMLSRGKTPPAGKNILPADGFLWDIFAKALQLSFTPYADALTCLRHPGPIRPTMEVPERELPVSVRNVGGSRLDREDSILVIKVRIGVMAELPLR